LKLELDSIEKSLKIIENKLLIYSFILTFILLFNFAIMQHPKWWEWIEDDET